MDKRENVINARPPVLNEMSVVCHVSQAYRHKCLHIEHKPRILYLGGSLSMAEIGRRQAASWAREARNPQKLPG